MHKTNEFQAPVPAYSAKMKEEKINLTSFCGPMDDIRRRSFNACLVETAAEVNEWSRLTGVWRVCRRMMASPDDSLCFSANWKREDDGLFINYGPAVVAVNFMMPGNKLAHTGGRRPRIAIHQEKTICIAMRARLGPDLDAIRTLQYPGLKRLRKAREAVTRGAGCACLVNVQRPGLKDL